MKNKLNRESRRSYMPRGFTAIFFTQLFSTLSFAVLYATLVLYMKQQIGFTTSQANTLTSVYFAYNFSLHLLAGFLGGRFFSYRVLVLIGVTFQLIGCGFLAMGTLVALYWGLACMLIGTGTMVTCLNMLLTQLFKPSDSGKRESAFLWNYSSMNIGFTLGFLLAGYYQLSANFTVLFIISSVINFVAILIMFCQWKALVDRNTAWSNSTIPEQRRRFLTGCAIIFILIPCLYWLLHHAEISSALILSAGVIMVCYMIFQGFKHQGEVRKRMLAFLILLISAQMFWVIYQLAPMSLTVFAKYNVNRTLLGYEIAPGWIQNINSITICIGAPILAAFFAVLRRRRMYVSVPMQFATGLLLSGIGLLVLPIGITFAGHFGLIALYWLFITYVLQAISELLISPIGYSMVGKLIPTRLQSIYMGALLLNAGVAAILAGHFSNFAAGSNSVNPLVTNPSYSYAFGLLGISSILVAFVLFLLTPTLHRMMQHKTKVIF